MRGPRTSAAIFDKGKLELEQQGIDGRMSAADFWSDQATAQKVQRRRKRIEEDLTLLTQLARQEDVIPGERVDRAPAKSRSQSGVLGMS